MPENPRIEELRRRVQADPASIAFAALAEEFRRVGRYEEAVATCRTGLQRHPAYLSARVTLGRALIETGDYAGAREELDTVLRSAPENLAAIRGLAEIEERLAHSTELDPHLADMMATHAESLRVAALAPPAPVLPPAPAAPEPEPLVTRGGPDVPFERHLSLAPGRDPQPEPAPVEDRQAAEETQPEPIELPVLLAPTDVAIPAAQATDPFAAFLAPPDKTATDLTFDLSSAFGSAPVKPPLGEAPPAPELSTAAPAPPLLETDRQVEQGLDAGAGRQPQPRAETSRPQEDEVEIDLDLALVPPAAGLPRQGDGPDPEVLATLARLERFLGAIDSLRASH